MRDLLVYCPHEMKEKKQKKKNYSCIVMQFETLYSIFIRSEANNPELNSRFHVSLIIFSSALDLNQQYTFVCMKNKKKNEMK